VVDEVETKSLITEQFIMSGESDGQTIGSVVITPNISDIYVQTDSVKSDSHIFVTTKDAPRDIFARVFDIVSGEGFSIGLNKDSDEEINVDWWIVDVTNETKNVQSDDGEENDTKIDTLNQR
jgi:hypothetical protein